MIFIITAFPAQTRTYLVATDDFALKVKGTFLDSLQCLMELHYVFDLAYAKELKPFFLLLELIADLDVNKSYTSLMDLYYDLKNLEDSTDEDLAPPSQPALATEENPPAESSETLPLYEEVILD